MASVIAESLALDQSKPFNYSDVLFKRASWIRPGGEYVIWNMGEMIVQHEHFVEK